jgi:hypothetical protein
MPVGRLKAAAICLQAIKRAALLAGNRRGKPGAPGDVEGLESGAHAAGRTCDRAVLERQDARTLAPLLQRAATRHSARPFGTYTSSRCNIARGQALYCGFGYRDFHSPSALHWGIPLSQFLTRCPLPARQSRPSGRRSGVWNNIAYLRPHCAGGSQSPAGAV